jgi:circadian clock protein KaiB
VIKPSNDAFDEALAAQISAAPERYELCLFIAGMTPLSTAALANVVAICNERLKGRYDLTVIDIHREPERAKREQVIAAPTLVKKSPAPTRRLIGDLSNHAEVIRGLGLSPTSTRSPSGTRTKSKHAKKTAKKA